MWVGLSDSKALILVTMGLLSVEGEGEREKESKHVKKQKAEKQQQKIETKCPKRRC